MNAYIVVDSLQGGAGTSTNMNVIEVIANRAFEQCRKNILNSTALITAIIPAVGYEKASDIVKKAKEDPISVKQEIINSGEINEQILNELISPEAVCRLGFG